MAADITETRPVLYRMLREDGWVYTPLKGGGGVFRGGPRDGNGRGVLTLQSKSTLTAELWHNGVRLARFDKTMPESATAAAAIAAGHHLRTGPRP